jgi:hypothetical protein
MRIVLAVLLLLAAQEPAATNDNGAVDGTVLRYGTVQPISGVQVFLTADTIANSFGTMTTDASGRFSFGDVPPGRYAVVARRDDYFASGGSGRQEATLVVTLEKKEHRSSVTLNLTPGSTISGRLIAPNGQPAAGIAVEAVQSSYDRMGRHTLTSAKSANTDDRGEYRIFWLAPGDYYVRVATQRTGAFGGRGNNRSQTPPRISTYYPGTDIFEAASVIRIRAEDSVSGIDFRYAGAPTGYTISGTVDVTLPTPAPQTGITTGVYLMPHRFSVIENGVPIATPGATFNASGGPFEIHDVLPGVYDLYPFVRFTQPTARSLYYIGRVTVEVPGGDVSGVSVSIRPGVEIRGRVTVNGEPPKGRVGNALVGWTPFDSLPSSLLSIGNGPSGLTPVDRETGEFTMTNVPPGVYRASYGTTLLPDEYVASARVGGKDVLGGEITIGNLAPGVLEVDVRTPGAVVQGTVVDTLNQPVPGAAVTLVPDASKRGIAFRYGSATTDKDGHFAIRSIAPGDYRIFATDFGTSSMWMNPDYVAKYESSGTPVEATTAKPSEVSLTLIPLDNPK